MNFNDIHQIQCLMIKIYKTLVIMNL